MEKLDINYLNKEKTFVKIGKLDKSIIDTLQLNCNSQDIVLWYDRFEYIQKHKSDFKSEEDFQKHIESIPDIVQNYDYIGKHPSDGSIQFIKRIDEIMLVGIRIKSKGKLCLRSAYPITQQHLDRYQTSGTLWTREQVNKKVDKQ